MFKLVGVEVGGTIQLYDMFVDGKWHGSRRTAEDCEHEMDRKADLCLVNRRRI